MLQVVCDRCHRELDPSRMESDDYSLTVYVAGGDDPVIAYEDLCDKCMDELLSALRGDVKPASSGSHGKPETSQKPKRETSAKRPAPRRPRPEPVPDVESEPDETPAKGGFGIIPKIPPLTDVPPVQDGKVVARKPVRHGSE